MKFALQFWTPKTFVVVVAFNRVEFLKESIFINLTAYWLVYIEICTLGERLKILFITLTRVLLSQISLFTNNWECVLLAVTKGNIRFLCLFWGLKVFYWLKTTNSKTLLAASSWRDVRFNFWFDPSVHVMEKRWLELKTLNGWWFAYWDNRCRNKRKSISN